MLQRLIIAVLLASAGTLSLAGERPDWAFFVPSPEAGRPAGPEVPAQWTAPGSKQTYSRAQLEDVLNPPDWFPLEHPAMPNIVAHGSSARDAGPLLPCALCHLPNGAGHVESASLAGLPADYIERQFADWRSGSRRIAVGDAKTSGFLTALKSRYSTAQVQEAARYFSALSPRRWIRVIETDTVPASAVNPQTLMRLPIAGDGREALGRRIVELPENPVGLVNRDAHSGFVAWVPRGSVAAGRALASQPDAAFIPACPTCHGPRLTGLAPAPPLAGRPPTYIVRQLWSFQSGARAGESAASMRLVAARLSVDQMLDLAAYLASCAPE